MKIVFLLVLLFSVFPAFSQSDSLKSARPVVAAKPILLDWKSLTWETTDYDLVSVEGGASLYTFPSQDSSRFQITLIFPQSMYAFSRQDQTVFRATSDLWILGGFGNLNFEQIQNYLTTYSIDLQTKVNAYGQIEITASGMSEDFSRTLDLLYAMLLKPKFDRSAIDIWKAQSKNAFTNLLESNTLEKQMRFLDAQASKMVFGKDHVLAQSIARLSDDQTNQITQDQVKDVYSALINRYGMMVFLSGQFSSKSVSDLKQMLKSIPRKAPVACAWLPLRKMVAKPNQFNVSLIEKNDMTQSNVIMRFYFPNLGKLNPVEKTQYALLQEIFSSSGGVVGNDRFSKALRADSGISYAPHAFWKEEPLYPNTNVSYFQMSFQSPNERLAEAVKLAQQTWDDFVQKGISMDELNAARSAMINRLLTTEWTVFDRSAQAALKLARSEVPARSPVEEEIVRLDALRDVTSLNELLKSWSLQDKVPVVVIMGKAEPKQSQELKSFFHVDSIDVTDVQSLARK